MKLHEYQSKQIFSRYGIPIPKGKVATTADEARRIAIELGGRVVIKSQVQVGGRGKAGGIRLAKDQRDAEDIAAQILSMNIKGLPVRKVLVDEAVNISKEIYLGITNDRGARRPVLMSSSAGISSLSIWNALLIFSYSLASSNTALALPLTVNTSGRLVFWT